MNKSDSSYVIAASLQPHYTARHFHLFYISADKPQKFLYYLEGMHPQYKINCWIVEPQSFAFPRLQFHY